MTLSLLSDWPDNGKAFLEALPDADLVEEQQPSAYTGPVHQPVALPPKESEPKNVCEMAKALVKSNPQWGESRTVIKNGKGHIYISPYKDKLQMIYHRSVTLPVIVVDVAILSPVNGWLWDLDQKTYERWVAQCRAGKPSYQQEYAGGRGLLPDNPRNGKQWR